MRKKIENALFELGITPNLKGFDYICKAVNYISADRTVKICNVYKFVAKDFETTSSRVERAIRSAFSKIGKESEAFNKYLGISNMTNSALLYTLAYRLREDNTDESRN